MKNLWRETVKVERRPRSEPKEKRERQSPRRQVKVNGRNKDEPEKMRRKEKGLTIEDGEERNRCISRRIQIDEEREKALKLCWFEIVSLRFWSKRGEERKIGHARKDIGESGKICKPFGIRRCPMTRLSNRMPDENHRTEKKNR